MPQKYFKPQGKTLFMSAGNRSALLVTRTGKAVRKRTLEFFDAHTALTWCMYHRTTFVFLPSQIGNLN